MPGSHPLSSHHFRHAVYRSPVGTSYPGPTSQRSRMNAPTGEDRSSSCSISLRPEAGWTK
jgi:hypothetical protein